MPTSYSLSISSYPKDGNLLFSPKKRQGDRGIDSKMGMGTGLDQWRGIHSILN